MAQEREPRRAVVTPFGAVVCHKNSADHVFVEVNAEGLAVTGF
jgi:hypothetical protein